MPGVAPISATGRSPNTLGMSEAGREHQSIAFFTTPGMGGTRLSQNAWLPVLRVLGMRPYFAKSLYVAGAGKAFDERGALVDPKVRQILTDVVAGFVAFAQPSG